MTDEQADAIYGRLCREISQLTKEAALLETALNTTGRKLEATGKQIQSLRFVAERHLFEEDVLAMWDNIEKYKRLSMELAEKKSQKEKIDRS